MKRIVTLILVICMVFCLTGCKSSDYKQAVSQYENGDLDQARESFKALGNYNDAQDYLKKIDQDQYRQALKLFTDGNYEEALALFQKVSTFSDSDNYITAITNPEKLIKEACEEKDSWSVKRQVSALNDSGIKTTIGNKDCDIKFDSETRTFACVKATTITWQLSGKYYAHKLYDGYVGHFEGIRVVIDDTTSIDGLDDDADVNGFWKEYWK